MIANALTRDQIFAFGAWLLDYHPSVLKMPEGDPIRVTFELIFYRFLSLFPEGHRSTMYECFDRRADSQRMRDYIGWLRKNGTVPPGIRQSPPQGAIWAFARHWKELERILSARPAAPKTAVLPNPYRKTVTPALARAAFESAVVRPTSHDRLALEAAVEAWRRATRDSRHRAECPACSAVSVSNLIASTHISRCPDHPAYRELRGWQKASEESSRRRWARVTSRFCPARDPKPVVGPNPHAWVTGDWKPLSELEGLMSGQLPPVGGELETLLLEWEHLLDRATDPCPDCGGVFPYPDFPAHLLACERHPARLRAADYERRLVAAHGESGRTLIDLALELSQLQDELRLLSASTEKYSDMQGFADGRAYSKGPYEEPWLAAQARASALLIKLGRRQPDAIQRPVGAPLRAALDRILACGLTAPRTPALEADCALLRRAHDEVLAFSRAHGSALPCPACRRDGLKPATLWSHLLTCRAHPAIARARSLMAELLTLGDAIEVPEAVTLPLEVLNATAPHGPPGEDTSTRYTGEALDRLDAREVQSHDDAVLRRLVDDWELVQVALGADCPGCGQRLSVAGTAEHLMGCRQLPAAVFADEAERRVAARRGPRQASAARLRARCDLVAITLARLVEANSAYWRAMGDGERGKSIEDPAQVPWWQASRTEARRVLDEVHT